jgi:hypothetical protein
VGVLSKESRVNRGSGEVVVSREVLYALFEGCTASNDCTTIERAFHCTELQPFRFCFVFQLGLCMHEACDEIKALFVQFR